MLHDISLPIVARRAVGLVGASGSGKTTLSVLIARFYDVHDGAMRIDGVDVRDATLDSIRT